MSDLKKQLQEYMDETGASQAAIGRAIDYSGSTISQFLDGGYKGDLPAVEKAVKGFLERQKERKNIATEKIPFVRIAAAKKLFEVARICHLDGEVGVVYSDAGLGKTKAAKQYAQDNSDVILIEADLGHTALVFFGELHRRLGMNGRGRLHDLFEDIVARLKGSGRLIIVDEAEHLPYRALELLRRVYDKAGVGVLLVGMPRLIDNLRGKRGEFAQLYSRVGVAARLEALKASDTQEIVHAVMSNANGVWKSFHESCGGNARVLSKLIRRSAHVAKVNHTQVTPEIVKETAKMLII